MKQTIVRRVLAMSIVIAVAAAAIAFLVLLSQRSQPQPEPYRNVNAPSTEQPVPVFPPKPPEESVVYSYTGTVIAIDAANSVLTLATDRGEKRVRYTARTQIEAQAISFSGTPETSIIEMAATLADIEINGTVTALSTTNIRGKSEFLANKLIINKN